MTYKQFKAWAADFGYSVRGLRGDDARPTPEMIEVMDLLGLEKYERFVIRLQAEAGE